MNLLVRGNKNLTDRLIFILQPGSGATVELQLWYTKIKGGINPPFYLIARLLAHSFRYRLIVRVPAMNVNTKSVPVTIWLS